MSNSPLVVYTKLSPNKTSPRNAKIDTITIHHMAGNLSVEACGEVFSPSSRKASSNYGIGSDGRIGMYVEEKDRAWTSSNSKNDNRAVTIEVANSAVGDASGWPVSDAAMKSLIELCVDICRRNGIKKLVYTGDTTGNLTMHKWFAPTLCPGPYLSSRFPYIANEVNKRLTASTDVQNTQVTVLYRVQIGAFSKKDNALKWLERAKALGYKDAFVVYSNGLYKVQVGAFSKRANAEAYVDALKADGFNPYIVTVKCT